MENNILLFDGVCNLCSGFVQFVLKNEKSGEIKFASLQSSIGEQIIKHYKVSQNGLESIVFIQNEKAYEKSEAIIKISRHLVKPWSFLPFFSFLPVAFRNFIYDLVASNRYRIFGKKDVCWIPDPKWKKRFLD